MCTHPCSHLSCRTGGLPVQQRRTIISKVASRCILPILGTSLVTLSNVDLRGAFLITLLQAVRPDIVLRMSFRRRRRDGHYLLYSSSHANRSPSLHTTLFQILKDSCCLNEFFHPRISFSLPIFRLALRTKDIPRTQLPQSALSPSSYPPFHLPHQYSFLLTMKFSTLFSLAATASLTLATPTPTLQKRADYCGQWDSVVTGTYTVYNVCQYHFSGCKLI
jgi:hypothetical protein